MRMTRLLLREWHNVHDPKGDSLGIDSTCGNQFRDLAIRRGMKWNVFQILFLDDQFCLPDPFVDQSGVRKRSASQSVTAVSI